MGSVNAIVAHILEADDESLVKDVLSDPREVAGRTEVKGYKRGRLKVVDMPGYTFLISFLTPVAYYDKGLGTYYQTSKQWSPTTSQHIQDWKYMIYKSPEHQADQRNWEKSQYDPTGHSVRYPQFHRRRQKAISALFRSLIPTMQMKPHMKRRLYRVDPRMRQGSQSNKGAPWVSGHLKHHDTGGEGLPRPGDPGFGSFFTDFDPDDPEYWDWQGSGLRSQEPHEPDER
jgi:hypothetical protein